MNFHGFDLYIIIRYISIFVNFVKLLFIFVCCFTCSPYYIAWFILCIFVVLYCNLSLVSFVIVVALCYNNSSDFPLFIRTIPFTLLWWHNIVIVLIPVVGVLGNLCKHYCTGRYHSLYSFVLFSRSSTFLNFHQISLHFYPFQHTFHQI